MATSRWRQSLQPFRCGPIEPLIRPNLVFTGSKPHLSSKTEMLSGVKPDAAIFNDVASAAAAEL